MGPGTVSSLRRTKHEFPLPLFLSLPRMEPLTLGSNLFSTASRVHALRENTDILLEHDACICRDVNKLCVRKYSSYHFVISDTAWQVEEMTAQVTAMTTIIWKKVAVVRENPTHLLHSLT